MLGAETVSVVIPVYNGSAYLDEAIDSVFAQTYPNVELVVVDDGSTDESGTVAMRHGSDLIYARQERVGNGAARNEGARLSSGGWLSFLDADDRWLPEKLTREAGALMADGGLDGVRSRLREFVSPELDERGRASLRAPLEGAPSLYYFGTLRRGAFEKLGGFTSEVQLGVGVDFSARWEEAGLRSLLLDDVLVERRLHASNNWAREAARRSDFARTVKAAFERRHRARNGDVSSNLDGSEEG